MVHAVLLSLFRRICSGHTSLVAREHVGWDGTEHKAHDRAWGFSGSRRTSHELVPIPIQFLWVGTVPFRGNVSEPVHIQCMCVLWTGQTHRSGRQLKQLCSWPHGSVWWFWHLEGQINCPSFSLGIASRDSYHIEPVFPPCCLRALPEIFLFSAQPLVSHQLLLC